MPSKLDSVCTLLPRLPSQTELIPLKFKCKLLYKGHYIYDYITPEKILNALRWLKSNNSLYADVEINDDWLQQSLANDTDLYSLVCQNSLKLMMQIVKIVLNCLMVLHNNLWMIMVQIVIVLKCLCNNLSNGFRLYNN